MRFKLIKEDDKHSKARLGLIKTANGTIKNSYFYASWNIGTVKGVHQHELIKDTLAQIILREYLPSIFKTWT